MFWNQWWNYCRDFARKMFLYHLHFLTMWHVYLYMNSVNKCLILIEWFVHEHSGGVCLPVSWVGNVEGEQAMWHIALSRQNKMIFNKFSNIIAMINKKIPNADLSGTAWNDCLFKMHWIKFSWTWKSIFINCTICLLRIHGSRLAVSRITQRCGRFSRSQFTGQAGIDTF